MITLHSLKFTSSYRHLIDDSYLLICLVSESLCFINNKAPKRNKICIDWCFKVLPSFCSWVILTKLDTVLKFWIWCQHNRNGKINVFILIFSHKKNNILTAPRSHVFSPPFSLMNNLAHLSHWHKHWSLLKVTQHSWYLLIHVQFSTVFCASYYFTFMTCSCRSFPWWYNVW